MLRLVSAHLLPFTLLFQLLLQGCASRSELVAPPSARGELPPSALTAAVRALETLAAVRPAGTLTQVRALSSDARHESGRGLDYVRVFLDLTVYARTNAEAAESFGAIEAALASEARATERGELASADRVRRALGELDWTPRGREDLVSFSDRIRLEVAPGRPGPADTGLEPSGTRPRAGLEAYVRAQAAREDLGPMVLGSSHDARGVRTWRVRAEDPSACFTREQIAGFLAGLEHASPAVRVTSFELERSALQPDPHAPWGWTFEAGFAAQPADPGLK